MEKENIYGKIKENMKVIEQMEKWKEKEFLHGLMEEDSKEIILNNKKEDYGEYYWNDGKIFGEI